MAKRPAERLVSARVPAYKLVRAESNDGGYISSVCICCGESGWSNFPAALDALGCAEGEIPIDNRLMHKAECPVGQFIKETRGET